jgi:nucleoside-diphosphate-sugar epimerase
MKILVTGARGKLGSEVVKVLLNRSLDVVSFSHSMSMDEVDWDSITVVVNCAAVIPFAQVKQKDYINGNVVFLQELITRSKGKVFIHFSTFSELYSSDFYQQSKMLANSLILINQGVFSEVTILPLPTLDDETLVNGIVDSALKGLKPTVNRLKYNYMSFISVAEFVSSIIYDNSRQNRNIADHYMVKDLFLEVTKLIDSSLITQGDVIDRVLCVDDVYHVMPELIKNLSIDSSF